MIEKDIEYEDLAPEEFNELATQRMEHYISIERAKGRKSRRRIMQAASKSLQEELGGNWEVVFNPEKEE